MSPLRSPQRVGSLSTLILLSCYQVQSGSSLSIPMKREAIQTFWDSTAILGSSQVMPSHIGDWILKSNKHNRCRRGRGWSSLAWIRWLTQRGPWIFSQEQGFKAWILWREREMGAQALDLWECLAFFEWPTAQGGRWGSIYSPHLK
jgi:hypothetical protein